MQLMWKFFVTLSLILLCLNFLNIVRLRSSTKLYYRSNLNLRISDSDTQSLDDNAAVEGSVFNFSQDMSKTRQRIDAKILEDGISMINLLLAQNERRCPANRRPSPQQLRYSSDEKLWQRLDFFNLRRHERLYTYSAHTDPRPVGSGCRSLPSLRLFSLLTHHKPLTVSFECHVWYEGVDEPFISLSESNETGMNYYAAKLHGDDQIRFIEKDTGKLVVQTDLDFFEFTLSCPLPTEFPRPSHVSVAVASDDCPGAYTTYIPIENKSRAKPQHEFGVCVTNGYDGPSLGLFVEWMELHRMLGVSEIMLYDTHFTSDMIKAFHHYRQLGFLTVRKMPHPLQNRIGLNKTELMHMIRNLRSTAINDCVLRAAYRHRWVIVLDLDEVIIPRNRHTYSGLLDEINQNMKVHLNTTPDIYIFLNMYFFSDYPADQTKPSFLRTLRQRHRARPSEAYTASKSFVNPVECYNMFNHYCLKGLTEDWQRERGMREIVVPATVGAVHHYRKCRKFVYETCSDLLKQKELDDTMLKYEKELTDRVRTVLELVQ